MPGLLSPAKEDLLAAAMRRRAATLEKFRAAGAGGRRPTQAEIEAMLSANDDVIAATRAGTEPVLAGGQQLEPIERRSLLDLGEAVARLVWSGAKEARERVRSAVSLEPRLMRHEGRIEPIPLQRPARRLKSQAEIDAMLDRNDRLIEELRRR